MNIAELYNIFTSHPTVTTDSRECPEGSIFFALKGASFNGNAFAAKALEQGCAYAVVDEAQYAVQGDSRYILTDNCLDTLQQLARHHRRTLGTKIVGVTGTNGKTTTKELIATVLAEKYNVLYTQGNFNNHIGVPKTLLRLTREHQVAVVEMGANHPGEIKTLTDIVEPDYGIITNVGMAHLEGFGSLEGVLHTKGELYDYLRSHNGTAFIHHDNKLLRGIAQGLHLVEYGTADNATLCAGGEVTACNPLLSFRWRHGNGEWHHVDTHLIGSYNISNMLAAACIGLYMGVDMPQIDHALASYVPTNNRSELVQTAHNRLIVDAYNANPTSMMAALNNFKTMQAEQKLLILGDMRELGAESAVEHQRIADYLTACGFEQVMLVGQEFAAAHHTYPTYPDVDAAIEALKEQQPEGQTILIKGSNGIHLNRVIEFL